MPWGMRHFPNAIVMICGVLLPSRTTVAQTYPPPAVVKDGTTVVVRDYAQLPLSSRSSASINFADQLGRVNFLRSEPTLATGSDSRFFVNDLNRNLYLLDKATTSFNPYINFEQVFGKFDNDPGYAGGLVTFAFDPLYPTNGTFYTVHTEDPAKAGPATPVNTYLPGLDLSGGYTTTSAINPPAGPVARQSVLLEWKDLTPNDNTFQGTARELMRVGFNGNLHPMGDLIFNPNAQSGDADFRNLYISMGDGGSGESTANDDGVPGLTSGDRHFIPQRLDSLQGKILRITPDLTLKPSDALGANGRYRVPSTGTDPNPFAAVSGAAAEVYAYGFRNPHRMAWDPLTGKLIANDIGLHTFEEIDIIHKGDNYGWGEREGTRAFAPGPGDSTSPPGTNTSSIPNPDILTVRIDATLTLGTTTPRYAAAQYFQAEGDAIAGGFVYRGSLMPSLVGKYIFGDITTGRIFYVDASEMIGADDVDPSTLADVHEIQIAFDSPHDSQWSGVTNRRVYDIVADEYAARGGDPNPGSSDGVLPGFAETVGGYRSGVFNPGHLDADGIEYGGGRADIRLALGGDGELYLLSKSDGMIRALTDVVAPLSGLPGDATADGIVDARDLLALATNWYSDGDYSMGNFNMDDIIDARDLTILAIHWQDSLGSLNAALNALGLANQGVPEPSVLTVASLLLFGRRRRSLKNPHHNE